MIIYRAVPYLVIAAPPAILLFVILLGGCTMARTSDDTTARARFYSDCCRRHVDYAGAL